MRLRVEVLGNWWVFESLCVSNPLRLWAVCVSASPPPKCETAFASPKCVSVFFAHLRASKAMRLYTSMATNLYKGEKARTNTKDRRNPSADIALRTGGGTPAFPLLSAAYLKLGILHFR